jgi:hypothetical protein
MVQYFQLDAGLAAGLHTKKPESEYSSEAEAKLRDLGGKTTMKKMFSVLSLVAFLGVASVARANTLTPTVLGFVPGASITYGVDMTSGELHPGDGFTIFDIGAFLGFGAIDPSWVASFSAVGSPFGSSLGPDIGGAPNVHFTYTGAAFEVAVGVAPFSPFTVLTLATIPGTEDWVSLDHLLGTPFVCCDGGVATVHHDQIMVPGLPEPTSFLLLGTGLLGLVGFSRRKNSTPKV